jgi:hypothetical protein
MAKKQAETRAASELFGETTETLRALGEQLGKLSHFVRLCDHLFDAADAGQADRLAKVLEMIRPAYLDARAAAVGPQQ